jgi:hypoxanthine phosphoribosyltransferase
MDASFVCCEIDLLEVVGKGTMPTDPGLKVIITADQLQKRVRDLGRKISDDYAGSTLQVICVLENAFIFMADLVRALEIPVVCHFVRPITSEKLDNNVTTTEIFFSPENDVAGLHVLLIEGLIQSGVTTDFLVRNMLSRGAASVKVCTLLDRQSKRRMSLQPDYFGFLIDENYVVGYGMGGPSLNRNLAHIACPK